METITKIVVGRATGIVLDGVVHVLKRSSSRYHLNGKQYVCQDGCCDEGLAPDVSEVILKAKEAGATKVILRTGQREYFHREIHGLSVSDVTNHVGVVTDGWEITPHP